MITATLQAPLKLRRRLPLWVGVPDSHVWATDHSSNTLRRTQEKDRNQRKCLPSRWADGAGSQVTPGLGRAAQGFRPSAHWRLQTPPAGGCLHLLDVRVLCPKTPGHWRNARLSTDLRKPDASQRGCAPRPTRGRARLRRPGPGPSGRRRTPVLSPARYTAAQARVGDASGPAATESLRHPVPSQLGLCTHGCPRCHAGGLYPSPALQNTACRVPTSQHAVTPHSATPRTFCPYWDQGRPLHAKVWGAQDRLRPILWGDPNR